MFPLKIKFRTLPVEPTESHELISVSTTVDHCKNVNEKVEKSKVKARNKKREKTSSIPAIKQSVTSQTRLIIMNIQQATAICLKATIEWASNEMGRRTRWANLFFKIKI
ncbi:hypothetical protein T10_10077 [Trichinella papuae]|uniref:Uncharacterized protein n=1 Tax=Trichinella papuae TaxID=268474 RepID=A0A0V1MRG6_9BILA|nr:hypothetical protein T10_10077 [Trichinella papuae]